MSPPRGGRRGRMAAAPITCIRRVHAVRYTNMANPAKVGDIPRADPCNSIQPCTHSMCVFLAANSRNYNIFERRANPRTKNGTHPPAVTRAVPWSNTGFDRLDTIFSPSPHGTRKRRVRRTTTRLRFGSSPSHVIDGDG